MGWMALLLGGFLLIGLTAKGGSGLRHLLMVGLVALTLGATFLTLGRG